MRSVSVVFYRLDPTRSADVPIEHFSDLIAKIVIIICDRYSAYKKLARLNLAIILAFCWVHVRREFLNLARSYPDLAKWGLDWADEISKLFHLNNQRIELWGNFKNLRFGIFAFFTARGAFSHFECAHCYQ